MTSKIKPLDELKIALDNRAFELQLFWQRSNYFLVLMSALGVAAFAIKEPLFSLLVSFLAVAASFLWFRTNLGSKFWQESWEVEVTLISHEMGVRSFQREMSEVQAQVRNSLFPPGKKIHPFKRWILQGVSEKPSVTFHMIVLSFISTIVWMVIFGISLLMNFGLIERVAGAEPGSGATVVQQVTMQPPPPPSPATPPRTPPPAAPR